MKILVLSDAHGDAAAVTQLKEEAAKADLVIFGGDFADVILPADGKPVLTALTDLHDAVFAVLGNHDDPSFKDELESKDICADGSLSHFERLIIAGSGGATPFTNDTPNERPEDDIIDDFSLLESASDDTQEATGSWDNLIMIMHNPPADTVTDKIASGIHVGSKKLRDLIEKYQPLLVVCGHIHEAAGIEKVGTTTVINPGALSQHSYAVVELSGGAKTPFIIEKAELKSF